MNRELIAELRNLLAEATPGEWRVGTEGSEGSHIYAPGVPVTTRNGITRETSKRIACIGGLVQPQDGRNARLIVAAVNALPALLDEIEGDLQ